MKRASFTNNYLRMKKILLFLMVIVLLGSCGLIKSKKGGMTSNGELMGVNKKSKAFYRVLEYGNEYKYKSVL